jgi:2-polyprenyl-3-methyl-5-hydroxy-6-metoxy-1,4-benzoquinol methylase
MDREEWLKKVRAQTETLYDHLAPLYWDRFGFYQNELHIRFIEKFLIQLKQPGRILDAACGAGRYDGILIEAGHQVLGIDQSERMLTRAREHFPQDQFPQLKYKKLPLQELKFNQEYDGVICVDAMEHIFPEDWPAILANFNKALKLGGFLYLTVEMMEEDEVHAAFDLAKLAGLPVVYGEVADKIDSAYNQVIVLDWQSITGELAGEATYHYYPSQKQVRDWIGQAGFEILEEASGNGYAHFLVKTTYNF